MITQLFGDFRAFLANTICNNLNNNLILNYLYQKLPTINRIQIILSTFYYCAPYNPEIEFIRLYNSRGYVSTPHLLPLQFYHNLTTNSNTKQTTRISLRLLILKISLGLLYQEQLLRRKIRKKSWPRPNRFYPEPTTFETYSITVTINVYIQF